MKNSPAIAVGIGCAVALGVTAVFGVVAVFLVQAKLAQERQRMRGDAVLIIVANADIPAGVEITPDLIRKEERLKRWIDPDTAMAADFLMLVGQRLRLEKKKGSPIRWSETGARPSSANAAGKQPWHAELVRAGQAFQAGDYASARARYEKVLAQFDERPKALIPDPAESRSDPIVRSALLEAHTNLACILALASVGRTDPRAPATNPPPPEEAARLRDAAFVHLEKAVGLGWNDGRDLAPLRDDPRWQQLLERHAK